jgi:hypothetical protein
MIKGSRELMLDATGCDHTDAVHTLCCPTDELPPVCGWFTHKNGESSSNIRNIRNIMLTGIQANATPNVPPERPKSALTLNIANRTTRPHAVVHSIAQAKPYNFINNATGQGGLCATNLRVAFPILQLRSRDPQLEVVDLYAKNAEVLLKQSTALDGKNASTVALTRMKNSGKIVTGTIHWDLSLQEKTQILTALTVVLRTEFA